MRYRALRFSGHAIRHMFGRDISTDDVVAVISTGEVIKEYSDDKPIVER